MALKGKVAIVTGSGGGIGRVIALKFAEAGANVVICDIDENAIKATAEEAKKFGVETLTVQYDGRDIESIDKVVSQATDKFKVIDILVNNTGIAGPTKPVYEVEVDEWDATLEVNLRGAFYFMKKVIPNMIENKTGNIVNISSLSGKKSLPNRSPYCASKMAIIGLTRCVAEELGQYDINVNAVCPGSVAGPRIDGVIERMAQADNISIEKAWERFLGPSFIKRAVPPEDIAEMVLFLSDREKSKSITGQDINVNCGAATY